jgi:HD superfamily phosphohydrolase
MEKEKIFHDTVHGDIYISSSYCYKIIDSILFQRLRRIEQTSMRSLYPCARHDRFIHSLGVFHLGNILIKNIETNSKKEDEKYWNTISPFWERLKKSFEIACLLHDVGHSPFSHTFEHLFDSNKELKLTQLLKNTINDETFSQDLDLAADSNPHEKMSAYLAFKSYTQEIEELGGNAIYIVRMILGIIYRNPKSEEEKIVNCLIPLLHGVIDVDRIDYSCRDQWASGFSSVKLNVNRILTSGVIVNIKNKPKFCFLKNALSQLQSLIDIKNYQKTWIFSHHKIQYDQLLLKKAVERFAENIASEQQNADKTLSEIFCVDIFENEEFSIHGHCLYLLSDDDLIHLMKQTLSKNPYAKEWLSRKHIEKPIWKTLTEYTQLFPNYNLHSKEKIIDKIGSINKKYGIQLKYDVVEVKIELDTILENEVYLYVNNTVIDLCSLKLRENQKGTNNIVMYYIFLENNELDYKKEIINVLKDIE